MKKKFVKITQNTKNILCSRRKVYNDLIVVWYSTQHTSFDIHNSAIKEFIINTNFILYLRKLKTS